MTQEEIKEQIYKKHLSCTCNEAYTSRNMADVDCAYCQSFEAAMDAMSEYASLRDEEDRWIPVETALPEKKYTNSSYSGAVICCDHKGDVYMGFVVGSVWYKFGTSTAYTEIGIRITHWQPLPASPSVKP